jgi:hypothetical protein
MPVMKVKDIKRSPIILPEPVHHGMTHVPAVFNDISPFRSDPMVMHTVEGKIAIPSGKIMNFVSFRKLLS